VQVKKKKTKRPWWRKPRNLRRVSIGALALLLVTLGAAYIAVKGEDEPRYNTRFASLTLPATTGE
jgi:hypothetical protein